MRKKKILPFMAIAALLLFNISTVSFAETEGNATQEITTTQIQQSEDEGAIAYIDATDLESTQALTASTSPSAVVQTRVHCIGSGLVDLDTIIEANMLITAVYGEAHFNSTEGTKRYTIYRPSHHSNSFADSNQWEMTPGTIISSCNSSGTCVFNFEYSLPWETVPYNFTAVVY